MSFAQVKPQLSAPLCLGSHGEEVKELQRLLNEDRIGPTLSIDGRFGKATHKALLKFQRRNGLKPDGIVGPNTAKLIGWGYFPGRVLPYVISIEEPPRPPMTSATQSSRRNDPRRHQACLQGYPRCDVQHSDERR